MQNVRCRTNLKFYQLLILFVICLPLVSNVSQYNTSPDGKIFSNVDVIAPNITNVSRICKLRIDDSALKNVIQLTHKSSTHVVRIRLTIYSGKKLVDFPNLKWAWANEIGRTIISLIAQTDPAPVWYFNTLSRGIKEANIVAFVENYECFPTGDKAINLVSDFLLCQLSQVETNENYKLCHTQHVENSKTYRCCSVSSSAANLTFCSNYSSIVLKYTQWYIFAMTSIFVVIAFPLILKYLRSFKKESNRYHITESPMALSSIFRSVMIEGKGPVKSAERRLVFSLLVTAILYFAKLELAWAICALVWIILFTVLDMFATNSNVRIHNDVVSFLADCENFSDYIAALTVPFNFKYLWNVFSIFFKIRQENSNYQEIQDDQQNYELSIRRITFQFFKDIFFTLAFLISFLPICLIVYSALFAMWIITVPYYFAYTELLAILEKLIAISQTFAIVCGMVLPLVLYFCVIFSVVLITRSLISFLDITLLLIAGLYLNGEFYSSIIAPVMILVVYCWKCWQSFVESKYFRLLSKIYDICKELENETTQTSVLNAEGNIEEVHEWPFTVNIKTGMVSKALYDELRKKYLPYDEVLFWFFVRMILVANFCLFVSVMMLFSQTSGISGELQVISTIAMATLPFIFDALWAENSLEQQQAADMKLKLTLSEVIEFKRKINDIIMIEVNCNNERRNLGILNRFFPGL